MIIRSSRLFTYLLLSSLLAACTNSCSQDDGVPSWEQRYASMDIPEALVLTPQQALEQFKTAPGIELDLIASEPLIGDPVAIEWDEHGRLYVVEMRGYMRDSLGTDETEPLGRVVRLIDRDGDGVMDQSEVFLDKLVNPRALAVINEGILIAEPPNLWLCEMSEPQQVCDKKIRVGDYGNGNPDDVEHDENRLLLAMNGWIYSAKSDIKRRINGHQVDTAPTNYRGQWGLSEDQQGRLFYNNNSTLLSADLFPANYIQRFRYAHIGLNPHAGLSQLLIDDQSMHTIRINPGVNRAYSEGVLRDDHRLNVATAVSGLQIYNGSQLPARWQGHAFVPEPAGNVVAQLSIADSGLELKADHSTYEDEQWQRREFLASTDERFRPVDLRLGPDGALYVIDMYRGIIQHRNFITEELRTQSVERGLEAPIGLGRIYRVRASDAVTAKPADYTSTEGLIDALSHEDVWPRQTAARLLRKPEHRVAVAELSLNSLPESAQVRALWLKHLSGVLTKEELRDSLDIPGSMRINALQLGFDYLSPEQLLSWHQASKLSSVDEFHLLAAYGRWPNNANAISKRRELLAANLASHHFRRLYITNLGDDALGELRYWLEREQFSASTEGQEVLQDVAMTAFLDSRSSQDGRSATDATDAVFAELQQSRSNIPAAATKSLLKGLIGATKLKGFEPVLFASSPSILAAGAMGDDDEVNEALYHARQAFTFPGDDYVAGVAPLTDEQKRIVKRGEALYDSCAVCHQPSGEGLEGLAPPLAESEWVTGAPEWLARIILHGVAGPIEVAGQQWDQIMPGHGHLDSFDDEAIAGLMTYMRRSWGNRAAAVDVELVATARAESLERSKPWTVKELQEIPVQSPFAKYAGEYKIPFMPIKFTVVAMPDYIILDSPQGKAELKPDLDGVFSIEDMEVSFYFVEEGEDVILKFRRGSDEVDMKRRD